MFYDMRKVPNKDVCVFSQAEKGQPPKLTIDFKYESLVKAIKVYNPVVDESG